MKTIDRRRLLVSLSLSLRLHPRGRAPERQGQMKTSTLLSTLFATAFAGGMAAAQDVQAGEDLYQSQCRNCHGPQAQGLASFPQLAGRDADYLVMRLEQYRAGERVGANSALMMPNAAELTDAQIAGVAAYIAQTFD